MRNQWVIPLSIIVLVSSSTLYPNLSVALSVQTSNLNTGPYVDNIIYKIIPSQDQIVSELLTGSIDMNLGYVNPVYYYSSLANDPDIGIHSYLRNGYGLISINCAKYPLNISGFRRAFAYAFDKSAVTDLFEGYSIMHDSLVPQTNTWCAENEFEWHYYTNQSDIGNQILDSLNFTLDPETGYRLTPEGSAFDISIDYYWSSSIAGAVAQLGVEALQSLHIDARALGVDFIWIDIWDSYRYSYDMAFLGQNFYDNDIEWLVDEFGGESVGVRGKNLCNFRNATYDSLHDKLLCSTTYEEVYEASVEMQKILHYNVPQLIVYENIYLQAYRNDIFTGYVPDQLRYISGPWTMRKIHKLDGTRGGIVQIGALDWPDYFNFWVASNPTSTAIFHELWPSLYSYAPDWTPHPYIAEKMLKENHIDNSVVPEGHTRYTIDIIRNATWSDGVPLTAYDVVYTLNYIIGSRAYGNPAGDKMKDLLAAYAPNPYRFVIEFFTESYWHFSRFVYQYIIPKHIFMLNISYDEWNTWNPVFDAQEPHVTAGPFELHDFEDGEYYQLIANPKFAYFEFRTTDHVVTTPNTTSNVEQMNVFALTSTLIAGFSSAVIFVTVVEMIRHKIRERD